MVSGPLYPGRLIDYSPPHTDEAMLDRGYGLPRIHLLKLSEKGCEQRSDRGFGRCTEAKMERKALSLAAHKVLLQATRDFSDSFSTSFGE
jgi:hypothetical protein